MEINVSQLLKAPIGSTRSHQVSTVVDVADNSSLVQGEVNLTRTDRGILVEGKLHTEVEATCSRCASIFSCTLVLDIGEEYFPVADVDSGASLPLPDEPGSFTIDENNVLDLTEALCQYALLAIPMKPLCHEGCAGLCLGCGRNLNQGFCNCLPQEVDPRWAELSKLASAVDLPVNKGKGME